MLLIYADPADLQPAGETEHEAWMTLTRDMQGAGVHRGGAALQTPDTATTVRAQDGEILNTDGPFAETREILGGFYTIDVDDLDAALGWAQRITEINRYAVEVRPVLDTGA